MNIKEAIELESTLKDSHQYARWLFDNLRVIDGYEFECKYLNDLKLKLDRSLNSLSEKLSIIEIQ